MSSPMPSRNCASIEGASRNEPGSRNLQSAARPDALSTSEPIARTQNGDPASMDRLAARYLQPLQDWAGTRLPAAARDLFRAGGVVQDCLMRTLERLDAFGCRHEGAFLAFFRKTIVNRIRSEVRRAKRLSPMDDQPGGEREQGPSPLEDSIAGEMMERYHFGLARLRDEEREIIRMRVELGYDYDEIARVMGEPDHDAARNAVGLALTSLAHEMEGGARRA